MDKQIWILSDRYTDADDSAEILYRYIRENREDIMPYFVVSNRSQDYDRLRKDGFNLISRDDTQNKIFRNAKVYISTQAAPQFYRIAKMYNKPFIFLQHGITWASSPEYFNKFLCYCDMVICSNRDEMSAFKNPEYGYYQGNTVYELCGLPRFDELYRHSADSGDGTRPKKVLIQLTWRKLLSASNFVKSEYGKKLTELLHSPRLKEICMEQGYEVVLMLHPEMYNKGIDKLIDYPSYISIADRYNFRENFINSSILITDYSSTTFNMGYMMKPTIYYQFDKKSYLNNTFERKTQGWFSFDEHGFGPVVTSLNELIDCLADYLYDDCNIPDLYVKRIESFFENIDDNNTERVFNTIYNFVNKPDKPLSKLEQLRRDIIDKKVIKIIRGNGFVWKRVKN